MKTNIILVISVRIRSVFIPVDGMFVTTPQSTPRRRPGQASPGVVLALGPRAKERVAQTGSVMCVCCSPQIKLQSRNRLGLADILNKQSASKTMVPPDHHPTLKIYNVFFSELLRSHSLTSIFSEVEIACDHRPVCLDWFDL